MAKRPADNKDVKINFRTDADWHESVTEEAQRSGLSLAAYIRLACIEKMDRDKARRSETRKED